MKIAKFLTTFFLFLFILIIIYIIHVNFFKVNVVFYSAILDSILATIIMVIILMINNFYQEFTLFEKIQMGIIFLLLGYSFAISIPTVLDRSLSFYLLEKIQQRGGGIQKSGFEDVFIKEYMPEHHLVEIRLTEQLESGTIIIENSCVKLTKKGEILATISRYFRKHFSPKRRLLLGKYTSDLIDPFGHVIDINKQDNFGYICQ